MSWSQATYQKAWNTLAHTFIPALFHKLPPPPRGGWRHRGCLSPPAALTSGDTTFFPSGLGATSL